MHKQDHQNAIPPLTRDSFHSKKAWHLFKRCHKKYGVFKRFSAQNVKITENQIEKLKINKKQRGIFNTMILIEKHIRKKEQELYKYDPEDGVYLHPLTEKKEKNKKKTIKEKEALAKDYRMLEQEFWLRSDKNWKKFRYLVIMPDGSISHDQYGDSYDEHLLAKNAREL